MFELVTVLFGWTVVSVQPTAASTRNVLATASALSVLWFMSPSLLKVGSVALY
jgi:hypothetical protein